jgi:hypothetical protein
MRGPSPRAALRQALPVRSEDGERGPRRLRTARLHGRGRPLSPSTVDDLQHALRAQRDEQSLVVGPSCTGPLLPPSPARAWRPLASRWSCTKTVSADGARLSGNAGIDGHRSDVRAVTAFSPVSRA